MIKFTMRCGLNALMLVVLALCSLPANSASNNASGDGSGIGGSGNKPSGGGIGGTGTKEQNSPKAMPDVPDRPETVELPAIEPPELPSLDGAAIEHPPELPEPTPATPANVR